MIAILGWAAPGWAWLLLFCGLLTLAIIAAVRYWRWLEARLAAARGYWDDLAAEWNVPSRAPGPDDTITDAEITRLIRDAAWAADLEAIHDDERLIEAWLRAGCPAAHEPWSLARYSQ